jgi:hypothetical protein
MVVNNNPDDDACSSLSSTCLPAGYQENRFEETCFDDTQDNDVEEAQEVDFSTLP